ncbi:MAG: hypothetical protein NZ927_03160 [Candidatus Calescibacterium sp.]|nr:hypothetical protein [Candidatus Calescibacterium sp.]MCX7733937.1 hypothetical protein [bacterium]MDW8086465.1 hypothetical protein [Candidatus Calescibacterium sp.]
MKFFHIVFDKKGYELMKKFLENNKELYHIVMATSQSLYQQIKKEISPINVEVIFDFDTGAEKMLSADKVVVW